MTLDQLGDWGVIFTALSPIVTIGLGFLIKRADTDKLRKLDELTAQVKSNGGATLRDAVDRIEGAVTDLTARIEQLETERASRGRRTR